MDNKYSNNKQIYYNREILVKSTEDRNIDLITISSHHRILQERNKFDDDNLFPERKKYKRARKFKKEKKIIFISARVHPGESPSSYAMKGVLNFLLLQ